MEYFAHLICVFLIFAIASLSMGLMVGYTGIVFVGAAAFMGVGAYTTALLTQEFHIPVWVGIIFGMLITMFAGSSVCLLFRNLRRDYLALATLGAGVILFDLFNNWISLTHGPMGLPGVEAVNSSVWITVLIFTAISIIVGQTYSRLERSKFGCIIRAIRDDEGLLHSLGYSSFWPFMFVFMIAFAGLGLAGGLFAHYFTYVDPSSFSLGESIVLLSMIIIGGTESRDGAFLGAALYIFIPEGFRFLGLPSTLAAQMRYGLFGLTLIVLMVARPQGILGRYDIK